MKNIYIIISLSFLFVSCSTKQYFNPQDTTDVNVEITSTPSYIKYINANGATLDDNRYLDKYGISKNKLENGFVFINNSNGDIISANKNGKLTINNNQHFSFKSNVISANLNGDLLALIFANNTIAIYDIKEKVFKFKKYLEVSYLNDTRIAMPLFLKSIVLFPTLNGKVIIVSKDKLEVIKTITVDPNSKVNNIILLQTLKDYLIVASSNVILSLGEGNSFKKELFIQSYTLNDNNIFIATLDGRILKLDTSLETKAKKKFKFAKIQAISVDKTLVAIESQGFLIKSDLDLKNIKIDKINFEDDEKTFSNKNKIYFEDKILKF